jgi:hypothetical protein
MSVRFAADVVLRAYGASVTLMAGPPSCWRLRLKDGSIVRVWADSLEHPESNDENAYRFCLLMDIPEDQQADYLVSARTPTNPKRVIVVSASFPSDAVSEILGSG